MFRQGGAEDDDLGGRGAFDLADGFEAAQFGHGGIEDDDVGLQGASEGDGFGAVRGHGVDLEIASLLGDAAAPSRTTA